jgi:hypothetical protein
MNLTRVRGPGDHWRRRLPNTTCPAARARCVLSIPIAEFHHITEVAQMRLAFIDGDIGTNERLDPYEPWACYLQDAIHT